MQKFWTWGGKYVGVRQKEYLVSWNGTVIGKFYGNEIYNCNGFYIGEIQKKERLINNRNKEIQRRPAFSRSIRGAVSNKFSDTASYPLIGNFADFELEE